MQLDDETTAIQLYHILRQHGFNITKRTVLRCRSSLGWTFRGSAYCQMIREANKEKRLLWCQENKSLEFDDVIWTDESSIQLETHRRFCCRKQGQVAKPKPRAKHPVKVHVHVWAGISKKGATPICIFDGTMDAVLFTSILDRTLLPFLKSVFPDQHRFMQDNDPKHTSRVHL